MTNKTKVLIGVGVVATSVFVYYMMKRKQVISAYNVYGTCSKKFIESKSESDLSGAAIALAVKDACGVEPSVFVMGIKVVNPNQFLPSLNPNQNLRS